MRFTQVLLLPFSAIYGTILAIRNRLFDSGLKRVNKMDFPIISIGNLSVGGTGKTPHVEFLAEAFSQSKKVGILLRGYGRQSKGFVKVSLNSKSATVGDEALQYKLKFEQEVDVAVCEDRSNGAREMLVSNKALNCLILDDAYQHRSIHRDCNILLTDYNLPFWKDFVLPAGRLREFRSGKKRADLIVVTKCPPTLTLEEKEDMLKQINPTMQQKVFFSSIAYGNLVGFNTSSITDIEQVVLVTGIANASSLKKHLEAQFEVEHIEFPDHHNFSLADLHRIHQIFDTFASENKVIVTTSKDRMRLLGAEFSQLTDNYPWYYQDIRIEMNNEKEFLTEITRKIC